jgi:hypothetical protein
MVSLYSGRNSPQYPLYGPKNQSEHCQEESLTPAENRAPDSSVVQPVG